MAGYQSSKEILRKNKSNLNKIMNQTKKMIEEEANSIKQDIQQMETNKNSVITQLKENSGKYASALEQTSSLIEGLNQSITNVTSSLVGLKNISLTNTSLLASNLISLVQINSVLTAFRADYIMSKNGQRIDGTSYYDQNLLLKNINKIKAKDQITQKFLLELKNAVNYANKSANIVKGRIGNNKLEHDDGIVQKVLGKVNEFKGLGGLLSLLGGSNGSRRAKISGFGTKVSGMDTSSIGGILESILGDKNKSKILKPLKDFGRDLQDKDDPFSKFLGEFLAKNGLASDKKQREKDPNLVFSALAPFADDIKDMVEFKYNGFKHRPKIIPDYATPVWIVNSKYQKNGISEKDRSNNNEEDLKNKRIMEILQGIANNEKDKYGNDLLKVSKSEGESGKYVFNGKLAGKTAKDQRKLGHMQAVSNQKIFNLNHEIETYYDDETKQYVTEDSETNKAISNFLRNQNKSGLLNAIPNYQQGAVGMVAGGLQGLLQGGGTLGYLGGLGNILKSTIRTGHAGGKKGKRGKKNKAELVYTHHGETVLEPDQLEEQNNIDSLHDISGLLMSTYTPLIQNMQVLFKALRMKFEGEEITDPKRDLYSPIDIIGSRYISKLKTARESLSIAKTSFDMLETLRKEKEKDQTMSEYFGWDDENKEEGSEAKVQSTLDDIEDHEQLLRDEADLEKKKADEEAEKQKKINEEAEQKSTEAKAAAEKKEREIEAKTNKEIRVKKSENTDKQLAADAKHSESEIIKEETNTDKQLAADKTTDLKNDAKRLKTTQKNVLKEAKADIKATIDDMKGTAKASTAEASAEVGGKTESFAGKIWGKLVDTIDKIEPFGHIAAIATSVVGQVALGVLGYVLMDKLFDLLGGGGGDSSDAMKKSESAKASSVADSATSKAEGTNNTNNTSSVVNVDSNNLQNGMVLSKEEAEKMKKDKNYLPASMTMTNGSTKDPTAVGVLSMYDKKTREQILKNANSTYGQTILNSKDPGNTLIALSNGPIMAGLTSLANTSLSAYVADIKNYNTVRKENENLNATSATNKQTFFGKMLNTINKESQSLKGTDISKTEGPNGYSENQAVAKAQYNLTLAQGNVIQAFSTFFGGKKFVDSNGNFLSTGTAVKQDQQEQLTKGMSSGTTTAAKTTTTTTTTKTNSAGGTPTGSYARSGGTPSTGKGRHGRSRLKRNFDPTMLDASQYVLSHGYKETNGGVYPQFFNSYLNQSGIDVQNASSLKKLKANLSSGKPAILMGEDKNDDGTTPFGAEPHYVVATGYDGKNIRVVDSESENPYDIYNADHVLSKTSIRLSTSEKSTNGIAKNNFTKSKHISSPSRTIRGKHSSKKGKDHFGRGRSLYGRGDDVNHANTSTSSATPSSNKYSKNLYVGDSRTVGLQETCGIEAIAMVGAKNDFFEANYNEIKTKEGYNIFCWFGANNNTASSGEEAASLYNQLASDLKGKSQVFAGTCGHSYNSTGSGVLDTGIGTVDDFNSGVDEFNKALLANLSSDVRVIDVCSKLDSISKELGIENMCVDNLHYTSDAYKKIKDFIEQQIGSGGSSAGNNNGSTATPANNISGVEIGSLHVDLKGYTNADEIFNKYLGNQTTQTAVLPDITPTTEPTITPQQEKEIEKEVKEKAPTSLAQPKASKPAEVYDKNGTTYIVNNIEYGMKADIKDIMDEFDELNKVQDEALDVINVIYKKVLYKKGYDANKPVANYDYSIKSKFK